jgi:hypothetical protein
LSLVFVSLRTSWTNNCAYYQLYSDVVLPCSRTLHSATDSLSRRKTGRLHDRRCASSLRLSMCG